MGALMIRSWLGGCHQFLPPAEWEAEKAQSDGSGDGDGDDGGVVVLALCLVGHTVAQDWCSYCQMEPNLLQVTIHHSMIHAMNQLTRLGGTKLIIRILVLGRAGLTGTRRTSVLRQG